MKLSAFYPDLWGFVVLGILFYLYGLITGNWRPWNAAKGVDGRMSTSKLQAFLWTVVVLFAYVSFYAARARTGHYEAIDVLPPNLLIAMGLSLTTMTVAKGITVGYLNSGRVAKTAPGVGDSTGAAALFQDDDNNPDLSKIQMMAWTIIAIGVYLITLHLKMSQMLTDDTSSANPPALPDIDAVLMVLMGLGQGGYIGKKLTMTTVSRLMGLSPSSGPAGTSITVTGTCLGDSPDGNAVTIDGYPIPYVAPANTPPATTWQDSRVTFLLPAEHPNGSAWSIGQVIAIGVVSGGQNPANTLSFTVKGGPVAVQPAG